MSDTPDDLAWLRDYLRASLAEADVPNRAALAKQYRDTLAAIAATTEDTSEGDAVDELTQRRAAQAEVPTRPARKRQRRASGN